MAIHKVIPSVLLLAKAIHQRSAQGSRRNFGTLGPQPRIGVVAILHRGLRSSGKRRPRTRLDEGVLPPSLFLGLVRRRRRGGLASRRRRGFARGGEGAVTTTRRTHVPFVRSLMRSRPMVAFAVVAAAIFGGRELSRSGYWFWRDGSGLVRAAFAGVGSVLWWRRCPVSSRAIFGLLAM